MQQSPLLPSEVSGMDLVVTTAAAAAAAEASAPVKGDVELGQEGTAAFVATKAATTPPTPPPQLLQGGEEEEQQKLGKKVSFFNTTSEEGEGEDLNTARTTTEGGYYQRIIRTTSDYGGRQPGPPQSSVSLSSSQSLQSSDSIQQQQQQQQKRQKQDEQQQQQRRLAQPQQPRRQLAIKRPSFDTTNSIITTTNTRPIARRRRRHAIWNRVPKTMNTIPLEHHRVQHRSETANPHHRHHDSSGTGQLVRSSGQVVKSTLDTSPNRLEASRQEIRKKDGENNNENDTDVDHSSRRRHPVQYTLKRRASTTSNNGGTSSWHEGKLRRCLRWTTGMSMEYDASVGSSTITWFGISLDSLVVQYLHWCFRSSVWAVFLSAWICFLILTLFFAVLLWFGGRQHPSCISGVDFETDHYFIDAFALSWTTFTTVGYGLIYTTMPGTEHEARKCTAISILVALESYVGLLFSSLGLAIIFAKVAREQSSAQVLFSDAILIRYTKPAAPPSDEEEESPSPSNHPHRLRDHHRRSFGDSSVLSTSSAAGSYTEKMPFPVLEFQMVNLLHNVRSGEIMDATVTMIASVDAEQISSAAATATMSSLTSSSQRTHHKNNRRPKRKPAKRGGCILKRSLLEADTTDTAGDWSSTDDKGIEFSFTNNIEEEEEEEKQPTRERSVQRCLLSKTTDVLLERSHHQSASSASERNDNDEESSLDTATPPPPSITTSSYRQQQQPMQRPALEEDPTGYLIPHRTTFARLELETQSHPFFQRTWTVRHVLDDTSPLLTREARAKIQQANKWPDDLLTVEGIRASIKFDPILVSFTGTSNADANTVYAQKFYEYSSVLVGYQFVNMLYYHGNNNSNNDNGSDRGGGKILVDTRLINDVTEQAGGGGEPLVTESSSAAATGHDHPSTTFGQFSFDLMHIL